jgi:hypothetical protein
MEYAEQARDPRSLAGPKTNEQPTMQSICDRLEKNLATIAEGVGRTRNFSHRLLDPRPEKVGKGDQAIATPGSIEGRLRYIAQTAEMIGAELHSVLSDLERAA